MASSSSSDVPERRGIPGASFVSDVQTYLTQSGLQERFDLFLILFWCLDIAGTSGKIPDIEKCLNVVATLQAKKGTGEKAYIHRPASLLLIYNLKEPSDDITGHYRSGVQLRCSSAQNYPCQILLSVSKEFFDFRVSDSDVSYFCKSTAAMWMLFHKICNFRRC
ncbi:hypothetical protein MKW98_012904 [Papaver atlanticum]|uniref:Uncharacterized protein n=1 Tax=Papaver atlanticum TaxID=357466 RepID=A0AAD4SJV9_9MAGN|nr:hypothetical protein MKW98_012904 [Papaver atlanticum]